jgi:hypothetical protein
MLTGKYQLNYHIQLVPVMHVMQDCHASQTNKLMKHTKYNKTYLPLLHPQMTVSCLLDTKEYEIPCWKTGGCPADATRPTQQGRHKMQCQLSKFNHLHALGVGLAAAAAVHMQPQPPSPRTPANT